MQVEQLLKLRINPAKSCQNLTSSNWVLYVSVNISSVLVECFLNKRRTQVQNTDPQLEMEPMTLRSRPKEGNLFLLKFQLFFHQISLSN